MGNQKIYCQKCDKWLDNKSDYTEIERNPIDSSNTIYFKCNDCGEKGTYQYISAGSSCGFCFKTLDADRSEWKKGPNYYKRVVKEHEFDEKSQEWTINHECQVKCQTCEENKPIKETLIGTAFSFGSIPYCDSCAWKGMKEEEKQTYKSYANSHVAEERRIYQRYLKLKNKFSDRSQDNSRERERERERRKFNN